MNSVEKETVLHCLKSMIDEEACEECPLYGTTGTDHCEKDCVRLAINALEQDPCTDAISRQAVLMEIDKYLCGVPFEEKGIDEVIKDLPLVIPAEKMGRWIDADVLDKIRAEIEEYRDTMPWESKSLVKWEAINYILEQIIDKYKAEGGDKE